MPFWDPGEWPPYDGAKYITDLAYRWNKRDQGRGQGTGWLWIRYPKERGMGEEPHLLLTSSSTSAASVVDLATIHEVAIGRLVRCDYWLIILFNICRIHLINYACNCVNYLYISKFMFYCILNF